MTEPDLANEVGLVGSLSKLFAVALGVLYLLGFLVVTSYLSRYGISSFAVLQLQYLIAGVWVLGPPVLCFSIMSTARRFEERVAPAVPGKYNWRRFAFSMLFTSIPFALFVTLLELIPQASEGMTWGPSIRLYLFYLAMTSCANYFWSSWRMDPNKETRMINRSHAAPFYLTFLIMIVISYAVWFSARIYPLIPFSFGGGRPLTVVFFEGKEKMPDEIQKPDQSAKRSIPYKLILTTDRSYVVVSPSDRELGMEISRESVAGMVVLK